VRKLALLAGIVATVAAVAAVSVSASPLGQTGTVKAQATPKLPPLPADVKSRKRWVIGVKCDFSPFGYIDAQGRNAGYDVEIARQFAELAFGKANRARSPASPRRGASRRCRRNVSTSSSRR
jgi:polar amino acid transport system substrate-binding protein